MNERVRRRTGPGRLAVQVVSRAGRAEVDAAARERALALVSAWEALAPGGEARPTAAGLLELLELAREAPASWDEVRAEWRSLCMDLEAARPEPAWPALVRSLHAAGELELARLWGVSLASTADLDAAGARGRV